MDTHFVTIVHDGKTYLVELLFEYRDGNLVISVLQFVQTSAFSTRLYV